MQNKNGRESLHFFDKLEQDEYEKLDVFVK